MMRKVLITSGMFVLTLLILVMAVIVTAAVAPQVLVNETTLNWGRQLAPRFGYEVAWTDASVEVRSVSLLRKAFSFRFAGFRLDGPAFSAQARQLALDFELSVKRSEMLLPRIGPATLTGGVIDIKAPPADQLPEPASEPLDVDAIIGFFQTRRIEPIKISIDSLTTPAQQQSAVSAMTFELRRPSDTLLELSALVTGNPGAPIESLILQASVLSNDDGTGVRTADVTGRLRLKKGRNAHINATIRPSADGRAQFSGDTAVLFDGYQVDFRGDGHADRQKLTGTLTAGLRLPSGPVRQMDLTQCGFDATSTDFLADDFDLGLRCTGALTRRQVGRQEHLVSRVMPRRLTFEIENRLDLDVSAGGRTVAFKTDVNLTEVLREPLSLTGGFDVDGLVDLKNATSPKRLKITFDALAAINRFERLVGNLAGSAWTVPAPLNQLRGVVKCAATGTVDLVQHNLTVPINCSTALSSPTQRVFSVASAELKRNGGPDGGIMLDAKVNLDDLRLVLPDFDMTKPLPRLLPDKRIGDLEPPPPESSDAFKYRIAIKSPTNQPVEIENSLTKKPVHVDVDIVLASGERMAGTIGFRPFEVEMFRRTAAVQTLVVTFDPESTAPAIDGRARMPSNDYRVFVSVVGTTAKPVFQVYTEPALPEREALAVMLFGYRPDVMAEDEMRTADEMQAAVADGAIGLLSMYMLASSPVESVGYNSHTGIFTARVKIREGLSLTVGSDAEDAGELGLRKRLGRNWAVEATTATEGPERDASARAMLRWSKRY